MPPFDPLGGIEREQSGYEGGQKLKSTKGGWKRFRRLEEGIRGRETEQKTIKEH